MEETYGRHTTSVTTQDSFVLHSMLEEEFQTSSHRLYLPGNSLVHFTVFTVRVLTTENLLETHLLAT